MRYLYTLILYLILPFLPIRLLWRSLKNTSYRKRIPERFAFFKLPPINECIWIHAVSLGEAISTTPIIKALLSKYPNITIIATTMTPTGAAQIQKTFKDQSRVIHLYVPYDYPIFIQRFLNKVKPKMLILMESELWPNTLYYTKKRNIPILLCNARLSSRSYANYQKIPGFIKNTLSCITAAATQTKLDAKRLIDLGLDPQKLTISGNVKFDISVPNKTITKAVDLRTSLGKERPIWIAASTHNLEEEKVLTAASTVLNNLPNTLLILVPRHPERFNQVFELCNNRGFKVERYSQNKNCSPETQVLLGDVMGQLLLLYAASDIAFVGGSLIKWTGHNLLEPAALAKPVISGPNLDAFLEISSLLTDADALLKVNNEEELANAVITLFKNSVRREKLGSIALDVVEKHRGATQKIMTLIEKYLVV